MFTGRVEGTVVATEKDAGLLGIKLLLVRVIENGKDKDLIVATDATKQAGVGDFVTLESSKEASLLHRDRLCPSDAAISGFIDDYHEEL
ncbi:MAG TPA: EutN/CcmL family microcompartment protein [Eubacteriales bacterium]|nr:EutN/CcmL family microcompartment protein [Clostridia bacterium]HRV73837.1 EutN/CcmL family microcompartment protein [Eubacteriales bacterium]